MPNRDPERPVPEKGLPTPVRRRPTEAAAIAPAALIAGDNEATVQTPRQSCSRLRVMTHDTKDRVSGNAPRPWIAPDWLEMTDARTLLGILLVDHWDVVKAPSPL